ncbi:MAG: 50S ribosomal protein L15 [Patescibacteria group bacterium]
MELHKLPASTTKKSKRIGRGYGCGKGGHTVGRGNKGARARVGRGVPLWFEGGQLPFVKRLPYLRGKLRFENLNGKAQLVRLTALEKLTVKEITSEVLFKHKLIRSVRLPVKVTGDGTLTRALSLKGLQATASAKKAIEKAGGTLA